MRIGSASRGCKSPPPRFLWKLFRSPCSECAQPIHRNPQLYLQSAIPFSDRGTVKGSTRDRFGPDRTGRPTPASSL